MNNSNHRHVDIQPRVTKLRADVCVAMNMVLIPSHDLIPHWPCTGRVHDRAWSVSHALPFSHVNLHRSTNVLII